MFSKPLYSSFFEPKIKHANTETHTVTPESKTNIISQSKYEIMIASDPLYKKMI